MRRFCGVKALAAAIALVACAGCEDARSAASLAAQNHVSIPMRTYSMTLPNGMRLVLDEDHRSPVISVNLSYRAGSKDDPPGRAGFAHLFEHLMFQGSKHVAKGEFDKYLAHAGALTHNAYTDFDRTVYVETVPSNQLELAMWLESDRMGFLLDRLDEANFANERNVVKNEYRQHYENVPAGLVWSITQAELYPEPHPYHRLPIGSPDDLDRASIDDVRAFFRKYYAPQNATLVLVGDLNPEAASKVVQTYFNALPSLRDSASAKSSRAAAANVPHSLLQGERTIEVEANVDEPMLVVSWIEPAQLTPEAAEVDCILDLQGGLLHRWLIDERRLAKRVRVSFAPHVLSSVASIQVTMEPGASHADVLDVIDNAFSDTPYAFIGAEAANHATNREAASLIYTIEDFSARADRYGFYELAAGRAQFLGAHIDQYNAIGWASLQRGKATYFPRDRRVVTIVRPVKDAPLGGRQVAVR